MANRWYTKEDAVVGGWLVALLFAPLVAVGLLIGSAFGLSRRDRK